MNISVLFNNSLRLLKDENSISRANGLARKGLTFESVVMIMGRGYSSVGSASGRHAADVDTTSWRGMGLFFVFFLSLSLPLRVNFECRLSYGVLLTAPVFQSHSLTFVRTLKIPGIGSHTIVRTK